MMKLVAASVNKRPASVPPVMFASPKPIKPLAAPFAFPAAMRMASDWALPDWRLPYSDRASPQRSEVA